MGYYNGFRELILIAIFGLLGFIIGFMFVSIFMSTVLASGEPPTPVPVVTPEPTAVVTPEPVLTPEPTIMPTPEPTIMPTPEPTPVVTPEVTVAPTVKPTVAPTAVPAVPVDNTTQINALLILQVIGLIVGSMALYGVYKLNKIISIWFGE